MQNNQLNGITVIQSDAFNAREIIDMTPCLVIGKSRSSIYLHCNLGYIPSNELDAKPCFIASIELNTPFFNQQLNIV